MSRYIIKEHNYSHFIKISYSICNLLKAVDLVLIPSRKITDLAIELNQKLESRELILSREKAVPHISLAMTIIDSANEEQITQKLKSLALQYQNIEIEIDHTFYHRSELHFISGIGIKKTNELMNLHNAACDLLKPYAIQVEVNDTSVFADGEKINYPEAASWPLEYLEKHSGTNFDPHITIGIGDIGTVHRQAFKPSGLALYHLGPFCTCNSLIYSTQLI